MAAGLYLSLYHSHLLFSVAPNKILCRPIIAYDDDDSKKKQNGEKLLEFDLNGLLSVVSEARLLRRDNKKVDGLIWRDLLSFSSPSAVEHEK